MRHLKRLSRTFVGGVMTLAGLVVGSVTIVRHLRAPHLGFAASLADYAVAGLSTAVLVTGFCLLVQGGGAEFDDPSL
jgi:hypothetical protein